MTSHWTADQVAGIDMAAVPVAPVITHVTPLIPGVDLWDYWPVQEQDGTQARIGGGTLFILLSAPALFDPNARHAIARLRLMHRVIDDAGERWRDLGLLFDTGFSPGSREWSGSAIVSSDHRYISLYYTVAGVRHETEPTFTQRLFETRASLSAEPGGQILLGDWSLPHEMLVPDDKYYQRDMAGGGAIGTIKAFRDPSFFRDSADGQDYILFAASLAQSSSDWNGAVGIARRQGEGVWQSLPPLIAADGLNNELERPHVVQHGGRYYCFWSTQQKVFADGGPAGPNGLYGMWADRLDGGWEPINGSGLVFANPPEAPFQAYSWFVLPDLTVQSFADMVGLAAVPRDAAEARAHFGGTPAPELRLCIDGGRVWLA